MVNDISWVRNTWQFDWRSSGCGWGMHHKQKPFPGFEWYQAINLKPGQNTDRNKDAFIFVSSKKLQSLPSHWMSSPCFQHTLLAFHSALPATYYTLMWDITVSSRPLIFNGPFGSPSCRRPFCTLPHLPLWLAIVNLPCKPLYLRIFYIKSVCLVSTDWYRMMLYLKVEISPFNTLNWKNWY